MSAVHTDSNRSAAACARAAHAPARPGARRTSSRRRPWGRPIEGRHARRRCQGCRSRDGVTARAALLGRPLLHRRAGRGAPVRGVVAPRRARVRGVSSLPGRGRLSGPRWAEHPRQHPSPVRAEDVECGGQKPGSRHRVPQLALQPGPGDAKAHELRQHLDEIRAADELDLVRHPPPRREGVTLLARIDAGPQPLLRPPERLKRAARVAAAGRGGIRQRYASPTHLRLRGRQRPHSIDRWKSGSRFEGRPGPVSISFRSDRIRQAAARARVNAERARDPWMRQIAQELAESLDRQARVLGASGGPPGRR